MKFVLAFVFSFLSTAVFAAASNQGCESSGNQAAGCGTTVNVSPNVSTVVDTTAVGVGIGGNAVSNNRNINTNLSKQDQYQVQGQTALGGEGGSAVATGGQGGAGGSSVSNATGGTATSTSNAAANNAGNTQSVTFTSPAAPEKVTVKTTGEAPTIISNTTANCRSAVGASAGWLGGAFGFGTTVADETCQLIELSKRLEQLGLKDPAIQLMCQDERAAKAMGSLCQ